MQVVYPRCCGLDVHKKLVVACLLVRDQQGQLHKEVRSFGTMTEDVLRLRDWLAAAGCPPIALEATGGYWKPIYNLLEDAVSVLVVNAHPIKTVPGRQTDVKDAEWIADLLQHGLLRASFIPDRPQRELRELPRYRTSLVGERAAESNRIQKVLEGATIKLAAGASDVLGVSGRAMLEALIGGTSAPAPRADLARGRLREKRPALERALQGGVGSHQRFLLAEHLCHLAALAESIARVSAEIAERLRPFAAEIERLDSIPGVAQQTAQVLLAEIGVDIAVSRDYPPTSNGILVVAPRVA